MEVEEARGPSLLRHGTSVGLLLSLIVLEEPVSSSALTSAASTKRAGLANHLNTIAKALSSAALRRSA